MERNHKWTTIPPSPSNQSSPASYIYNLSRKLSANPDKAEDLAQETFIKAWAHISEVKNEDAVKSWLRTICINEFRMMLRKEKRGAMGYAESMDEL